MFLVAAVTLVLDQSTKAAARTFLDTASPFTLISGFADLHLSFNRGAAFGMLPTFGPVLIIIALVAIYAIIRFRHAATTRALAVGLGLLLGGAVGNVLDRIINPELGVTDFISLHIQTSSNILAWPTFNLADAALIIGVFITLIFARVRPED